MTSLNSLLLLFISVTTSISGYSQNMNTFENELYINTSPIAITPNCKPTTSILQIAQNGTYEYTVFFDCKNEDLKSFRQKGTWIKDNDSLHFTAEYPKEETFTFIISNNNLIPENIDKIYEEIKTQEKDLEKKDLYFRKATDLYNNINNK